VSTQLHTSPATAGEAARSAGEGGLLSASTDPRWFDLAVARWQDLLLDHANCEKKAASTALALMFSYPEDFELAERMSRLAREELRHFELVQQRLKSLHVPFRRLSPSRYAEGLRKAMRRSEPGRRVDLLLVGALIEARSHERFIGLIPRLGEPLGPFYESLAASESRHASLYLKLADKRGDAHTRERLAELAAIEAELATSADGEFRFHSGTPGRSA
jgi:tRNA-(ms[2]io[6]A)-hydroxylase